MRNNNKNLHIILFLIILFGISIGYAAINRTLSITGNSEVKQNTWNVYFDNVKVTDGSVGVDSLPVVDTETINFNVVLNLPGDFYEFTVEVKNAGTIDAMIDSIEKVLNLTEEQKKYINYIITYQGGGEIKSKQLVKSNDYLRIKVRVEYRTDITENDLPTVDQNLNLSFTLNYVQADSTALEIKNHGIIGINGDINEIGTIVTIGTENFYTIGTEGDNVKLLSMYNLYVRGDYNSLTETLKLYGEEATGMQNSKMRGFLSKDIIARGITVFSSDEQKGENYSSYNGSIVEGYVNNYKNKLEENFDVSINEARLINLEELTCNEIGCSVDDKSCLNAPNFIYSTSYWTGIVSDASYLRYVLSSGYFGSRDYKYDYRYGVRPVIVISKDYFL